MDFNSKYQAIPPPDDKTGIFPDAKKEVKNKTSRFSMAKKTSPLLPHSINETVSANPYKTGLNYFNQKKYDLAIKAFKASIELDQEIKNSRLNLGLSYMGLEKYKEAN